MTTVESSTGFIFKPGDVVFVRDNALPITTSSKKIDWRKAKVKVVWAYLNLFGEEAYKVQLGDKFAEFLQKDLTDDRTKR